MKKEIVKDVIFLAQKSEPATKEDIPAAKDLLDTLEANTEICVGMAANMIGVKKRFLCANTGKELLLMYNPVIVDRSKKTYEADEGCLSLTGTRKVVRNFSITVEYFDRKWKKKKQTFSDRTAQIIQHEMDHFEGILI